MIVACVLSDYCSSRYLLSDAARLATTCRGLRDRGMPAIRSAKRRLRDRVRQVETVLDAPPFLSPLWTPSCAIRRRILPRLRALPSFDGLHADSSVLLAAMAFHAAAGDRRSVETRQKLTEALRRVSSRNPFFGIEGLDRYAGLLRLDQLRGVFDRGGQEISDIVEEMLEVTESCVSASRDLFCRLFSEIRSLVSSFGDAQRADELDGAGDRLATLFVRRLVADYVGTEATHRLRNLLWKCTQRFVT